MNDIKPSKPPIALLKFTPEQSAFIKGNGSHITDYNSDWYNMPFWYREVSENVFESVEYENLPKGIKELAQGFTTSLEERIWQHKFPDEPFDGDEFNDWSRENANEALQIAILKQ